MFLGGTTPPKDPGHHRPGSVTETRRRGANGPGKARQTSSTGRCEKPHHPTARPKQPERQEVRPVTRGQRPATSRGRPREKGADANHVLAGVSAPRLARPSPAGDGRTGRRGLTRKTAAGNSRGDPAMRSKSSHAAESGVGEHTARESEAPNSVRMGKSAWRTPTPKFGPGVARLRGLLVFKIG